MATTTQNLVDYGLMDEDGVDADDLANSDIMPHRRRYKRNLQREVDFIWNYRDWPWKQSGTLSTLVVPAYNSADPYSFSVAMPDDQGLGRSAAPQLANQPGLPTLMWVPQATMNYLLLTEKRSGTPTRYSIFTEDTTGLKKLFLYPLQTVATSVIVPTEIRPPVCHDAGDAADTDPDELVMVPEQYHMAVLYEGMILRAMKDKSSAEYTTQLSLYKLNVKNMVSLERSGREAPHRLLPYGVSARGRTR